jgi:hypothetical protein
VDLLAVRGDLHPGGAQVAGIGQAADQARFVKYPDHPRHHGGVKALEFRQLGEAQRAPEADQGEYGVLSRGQAFTRGGVVQLAGEPADHRPQPCYEFDIHLLLPGPDLIAC